MNRKKFPFPHFLKMLSENFVVQGYGCDTFYLGWDI